MPGFVIHTAIGAEYIKKHPNEIKEQSQFFKGILAPDLKSIKNGEDKSKLHYGIWGKYQTITYIDEFLKDKKVDMKKDYWKGYFFHLLTDHYFYNIDFKDEHSQIKNNKDTFYKDYDCLNKDLIKKYNLINIDEFKEYIFFINEQPKYLNLEKIIKFIDKISSFDIDKKIKTIEKNGMK